MYKKITTFVIVAIFFFALGIFVGTKLPRKTTIQGMLKNDSFQAGWDAAKERLKQTQTPIEMGVSTNAEIKTVNGTIEKIDGNKLTVKIIPLESLADPALDTRIISIDANTKISLSAQKDPQTYQQEMQAFQDQIKNQQPSTDPSQPIVPVTPPAPFEQKDIKISDLKENQQISATSNQDIKDQKEFVASVIIAQQLNLQTPPAAAPVQ